MDNIELYNTHIDTSIIVLNLVSIVVLCFAKNSYDVCDKTSNSDNLKNIKNGIDTIITTQAIMIAISVITIYLETTDNTVSIYFFNPLKALLILIIVGGFTTVLSNINDKYKDIYLISSVFVSFYSIIAIFLVVTYFHKLKTTWKESHP